MFNDTNDFENRDEKYDAYDGRNEYRYGGYDSISQVQNEKEKKSKSGPTVLKTIVCALVFGVIAGLMIALILRVFYMQGAIQPAKDTEDRVKESISDEPGEAPDSQKDASLEGKTQSKNVAQSKDEEQDMDTSVEELPQSDAKSYTVDGGISATESLYGKDMPLTTVTDVSQVVERVMPSVVSIYGTYEVKENFWGYQYSNEEKGSGSGIIVGENDEELLIVTNNHVVEGATKLSVQFIDDTTISAVVKGTDSSADLAVISVDVHDLSSTTRENIKVATLGDSELLKVGEPAIAIGNALGYGQSVTCGVISALNRECAPDEDGNISKLIQTDAAINPGNSGGALLNVYGEVIGINSNKIAGSTIEGMGYAIPISTAKPIIEELMSKKTRRPVSQEQRGYLGISGVNVTDDVHDLYGLPKGVYVAQVFMGTPAYNAGIRKGDIIISFDGQEIDSMEELSGLLDCSKAGDTVDLEIYVYETEEYTQKTISVTLEKK